MKRHDAYNLLQKKYESALTQNAISAIQLSETLEEINAKTPTLRDQFAMAALAEIMRQAAEYLKGKASREALAQTAYLMADAMLAARK